MDSKNKMLLNTTLGIVLAASMVLGLSSISSISNTSEDILRDTSPIESAPKMQEGDNESSIVAGGEPMEEKAFSTQDESDISLFSNEEPLKFGTPFTIAFVFGLVAFIIVRSRLA
jgi:hypothetical protein